MASANIGNFRALRPPPPGGRACPCTRLPAMLKPPLPLTFA